MALSHSQYKAELDELRKWINDLSDLLGSKVQHRTKSAQTSPSTEILPTKQTLPLPSSIIAINKASKQLGAGLKKAWTCSNTAHDSHCIALWLDAQFETDDVVHMDVAISCTSRKSARSSSSFSMSLA